MAFLSSCKKDSFFTGTNANLRLELDTLRFDTVFTELGSATRFFKIYNDLQEDLEINNIRIEGGDNSFFRLNVDGTPGNSFDNLRINAGDSAYIFAEVTIDPDQAVSISPFIVEDWLRINTGDTEQSILLEAWGQNANYIPSRFSDSQLNLFSCDLGEWVWDDPRPYVIYGGLIIDSCRLVLPAGTRVHVHGGLAINELGVYNDGLILVTNNASIHSLGTVDEPVIIQGDRLEEDFQFSAGQWNGINLLPGSTNNIFRHTHILHPIVGLRVDSSSQAVLNSCEIAFTASSGLLGVHSSIEISNSLFYENGSFGIQLSYGGNYNINFCTVANYNNQSEAIRIDNFFDLSLFDEIPPAFNPANVNIKNSIFVGNDTDEISLGDGLDGYDPSFFNYEFDHCIVNVDELIEADQYPNFFDNCINCIQEMNGDTLFINLSEYDFHLDTMSIAQNKGISIFNLDFDKDGRSRDGMPDLGCYEFID